MGKLLLNLVLKYIERNPDKIVELLVAATEAAINAIKAHNAKMRTELGD